MTTLSQGTLFAGRFTVLRLVQEDPRGEVYAARSEPDQEVCRLRLLPADLPVDEEAAASLAAAMAALPAHEAFPPIVASGMENGRVFAATRWIEGSSLADVVRARGRLPPEEVRVLAADLGAALLALHATGTGHGALFPDLVTLSPESAGGRLRPRLLDTGILHFLLQRHKSRGLFLVQARWPDISWIPHGRLFAKDLDPRLTDVYCFALLVHLLLVGRTYWTTVVRGEDDYLPLMNEIGRAYRELPSARAGGDVQLPEGFDAWFKRCLAHHSERLALAAAVADFEDLFARVEREARAAEEAKRAAEEWAGWERRAAAEWAAIVAAQGQGLASYRAEEGNAVAGGVVFDLPSWVPPEGRRSIVEAMVTTARVLEGQARLDGGEMGARIVRLFGRGGERRYQRALEELEISPLLRPKASYLAWRSLLVEPVRSGACAGLDEDGLTVEYPRETWVTSHEKGWTSIPYARVPKESLPFDLGVFSAMVRAIAGAASGYDPCQPERACSYCGETFAPIDMHDKTTCHGCAEIHLGVVH